MSAEAAGEITLREYGDTVSVPLDAAAGRALAASRMLESVAPDPERPGHWRLRAGSRVGAVRLPGGTVLRIAPKTPVRRLFFLLGFSLNPGGAWRDSREGTVNTGAYDDVVPALAYAVERQLDGALRQGVLQGYREVTESAPVVRGRIREAEQIRRHFGRTPPVEIVYDAYTADTAANRILRAAVERLLRLPCVPGTVRRRLAHQRTRLADVGPLVRGQELPRWQPSRLNSHYQPALRLAEAVLHGTSPEHRTGALALDGFLLDMNKLFEDFVTVALREALREHGLTARLQDKHHLDSGRQVLMKPDLVVYGAGARTPVAVVDAKYKTEKADGYPNADLYQALAYATVLGLREAHLVYAAGRIPERTTEVRGTGGLRLLQHSLDLSREPAALLRTFRDLAARLAGPAA
ncbi:restriction endonuclease [Streptomyces sp. H27-C3]|uniref:McrC family protein n=1 Tax=Streptomyces sp. H27-C3 TaxID=3046305 RepID=UPI0024B983B9|nr:restriction endonuclease [Streptomyces sp. H27-C3]MDJ0465262.1 restriction endonuclease [Streptomyces sp. H27-C3]